ncbi:hypothetical protein [Streptomyces sp. NBC_01565]|uniref:hypothetical protein n=1 Tax=Streptomyces sp. NBC_01565 TaxID=2975881 RepID=UPI002255C454|nr:hypothetical protein [Streptomyces sp. NBC_01565]MCX4547183.1 hypothetical protein [Streptomyces sp. NBC_01565]
MADTRAAERRLASGEAVPHGLPMLSSICGTACVAGAVVVTTKSQFFFEHHALSVLAWAAVGGLGFAVAWGMLRRLGFQRRPLTPGMTVVAQVLAFAGVWGVQAAASHVYMSPWARYVAELAGPGQCLAATPYGVSPR